MVAPSEPAAEVCAPGPVPTEVYKPGDVVRKRIKAPTSAFLKTPFTLNFGPSPLPDEVDRFIIAAVIREESLFGEKITYKLSDGASFFSTDPALVIRVDEPQSIKPADLCDCHAEQSFPTHPATEHHGGMKWFLSPSTGDEIRTESEDGRFVLTLSGDDTCKALDTWTGEEVFGLATQADGVNWCRDRLEGVPLTFGPNEGTLEARTPRGRFRIVVCTDGRFFASDLRFPSPGQLLRQSPWFHSREQAEAWCRVRAACVVVGEPTAAGCRLEYSPEIPF